MTKKLKNVGASVRSRLLDLSKTRGDDFQLVLVRYVNERLLYRIASSPHAKTFILKGAALFTIWTGKPHRATRDLDQDLRAGAQPAVGRSHAAHPRSVLPRALLPRVRGAVREDAAGSPTQPSQ